MLTLQDGLSSGHASDLDDEESHNPSVLTKLARRARPAQSVEHNLLSNILAMESLNTFSSRLPPPSPAPETPGQVAEVAAAIKDIRAALQSSRSLQCGGGGEVGPSITHNLTGGTDPWLPRAAHTEPPDQSPPPPLPPPPCSLPPSPACSTPPPPPPVHLQEESESELELEEEEERVPTPEIMKKEEEDLDTDQVSFSPSVSVTVTVKNYITNTEIPIFHSTADFAV